MKSNVNIFDVPGAGVVRVMPKPTAQFKAIQKAREAFFGTPLSSPAVHPSDINPFPAGHKTAALGRALKMFGKSAPAFGTNAARTPRPWHQGYKQFVSPGVRRQLGDAMRGGGLGFGIDALAELAGHETGGAGTLLGTLAGFSGLPISRRWRTGRGLARAAGTYNPGTKANMLMERRKSLLNRARGPLHAAGNLSLAGMLQESLTGGEMNMARPLQTYNNQAEIYRRRLENIYHGRSPDE